MTSPQSMNDHGIAEGYLAECEDEVRMMGRTLDTLHSQLALKERELQRLLVVGAEQASVIDKQSAEIVGLEALLAAQEAAASV